MKFIEFCKGKPSLQVGVQSSLARFARSAPGGYFNDPYRSLEAIYLGALPRIAFDISIVSPFRSSNLGQGSLSAAESQAERKRRDCETAQRCHSQGIGFEILLFEYSGGLEPEGDRLLISLCRAVDDNLHRKTGSTS